MNGNKEYYEANRDVIMYNRKQMRHLYNSGIWALTRFHSNIEDKESNSQYWQNPQTLAIYRKLIEIGVSLGYYINPRTLGGLSTDSKEDLSYVYDMENIPNTWVLERSFAYEITFLYYLNLNSDIYVPRLFPQSTKHLIEIAKGKTYSYTKEEETSEGVVFQLY